MNTLTQAEVEALEFFSDERLEELSFGPPTQGRCLATIVRALRRVASGGWITVSERLPEDNISVLVYTPDRGDGDNISFDARDEGGWVCHDESYEHYMAVGGRNAAGPDAICTGPSEEAPYTHWKYCAPPQPEATKAGEHQHEYKKSTGRGDGVWVMACKHCGEEQ